jgi:hypothetical protein
MAIIYWTIRTGVCTGVISEERELLCNTVDCCVIPRIVVIYSLGRAASVSRPAMHALLWFITELKPAGIFCQATHGVKYHATRKNYKILMCS